MVESGWAKKQKKRRREQASKVGARTLFDVGLLKARSIPDPTPAEPQPEPTEPVPTGPEPIIAAQTFKVLYC